MSLVQLLVCTIHSTYSGFVSRSFSYNSCGSNDYRYDKAFHVPHVVVVVVMGGAEASRMTILFGGGGIYICNVRKQNWLL